MSSCCYAIIPDGATQPAAIFEDLEDALDWALRRYGADSFLLRHLNLMRVERADRQGAAGPV
jgi:hypothetical protein